jgi:hypothetical protein
MPPQFILTANCLHGICTKLLPGPLCSGGIVLACSNKLMKSDSSNLQVSPSLRIKHRQLTAGIIEIANLRLRARLVQNLRTNKDCRVGVVVNRETKECFDTSSRILILRFHHEFILPTPWLMDKTSLVRLLKQHGFHPDLTEVT